MKKRSGILCILISALVMIAAFPLEASAATDYGMVFNNLTAADVATYNTPLPKGGMKQSKAQIDSALNKIGFKKPPGKGSVLFKGSFYFAADDEGIYSVWKTSRWTKQSGKKVLIYQEDLDLFHLDEDSGLPTIFCTFSKISGTTSTDYCWYEGDTWGSVDKSYSGPDDRVWINYKKYKDATVLGQKCFVYSSKSKYGLVTDYYYVSRKTGLLIKNVEIGSSDGMVSTTINFVQKYTSKASSFFAKPEGVSFTSYY